MALRTLYCIAVLAPILAINANMALATGHEETFIYGERMTFDEGCTLAEQALKRNAVARQCGSRMSGGSMRVLGERDDMLYRLHFETTGGRVTDYKLLERKPGEAFACSVRANVTVQCDQGQRDPGFLPVPEQIVRLNETVFREGEALRISGSLPADLQGPAYLSIVVLMPYEEAHRRVAKLYPNPFENGEPFKAGEAIAIPSKNKKYDMALELPQGRPSADEALMFIFSRKPVSLPVAMSIEQLHSALSEIPLNERRELVMTYRIEARVKR